MVLRMHYGSRYRRSKMDFEVQTRDPFSRVSDDMWAPNTATGNYNFCADAIPEEVRGFPDILCRADELLAFSTTPIRYDETIYGTGFFFQLPSGMTVVVTCKHVITQIYAIEASRNTLSYQIRSVSDEIQRQYFGPSDIFMDPHSDLVAIPARQPSVNFVPRN